MHLAVYFAVTLSAFLCLNEAIKLPHQHAKSVMDLMRGYEKRIPSHDEDSKKSAEPTACDCPACPSHDSSKHPKQSAPSLRSIYNSLDSGTSTLSRFIECEQDDIITVYTPNDREYLDQMTSITGFRVHDPEDDDLVAFHAHLTNDKYVLNDHIIIFEEDPINYGAFYFPAYGIFVCPDDEFYAFLWSVTLTSEFDARAGELRLVMEGQEVKAGPKTSNVVTSSNSCTSSSSAVVQCEREKAIALQAVVPSSDNDPIRLYAAHTNFIGFRLAKI